ncbi:unnamed protein product [Amoebophrya sp. A120]|nr:unnamed protein product [Amoebophrya sp. A120]|eukprot:GSA120T00020373001.1
MICDWFAKAVPGVDPCVVYTYTGSEYDWAPATCRPKSRKHKGRSPAAQDVEPGDQDGGKEHVYSNVCVPRACDGLGKAYCQTIYNGNADGGIIWVDPNQSSSSSTIPPQTTDPNLTKTDSSGATTDSSGTTVHPSLTTIDPSLATTDPSLTTVDPNAHNINGNDKTSTPDPFSQNATNGSSDLLTVSPDEGGFDLEECFPCWLWPLLALVLLLLLLLLLCCCCKSDEEDEKAEEPAKDPTSSDGEYKEQPKIPSVAKEEKPKKEKVKSKPPSSAPPSTPSEPDLPPAKASIPDVDVPPPPPMLSPPSSEQDEPPPPPLPPKVEHVAIPETINAKEFFKIADVQALEVLKGSGFKDPYLTRLATAVSSKHIDKRDLVPEPDLYNLNVYKKLKLGKGNATVGMVRDFMLGLWRHSKPAGFTLQLDAVLGNEEVQRRSRMTTARGSVMRQSALSPQGSSIRVSNLGYSSSALQRGSALNQEQSSARASKLGGGHSSHFDGRQVASLKHSGGKRKSGRKSDTSGDESEVLHGETIAASVKLAKFRPSGKNAAYKALEGQFSDNTFQPNDAKRSNAKHKKVKLSSKMKSKSPKSTASNK